MGSRLGLDESMSLTEIPQFRCGYCSSPSEEDTGKCQVCGSALYDCHKAIAGARNEEYVRRALRQGDRGWSIVKQMQAERAKWMTKFCHDEPTP
jgi:hypothetical protein